MAGSSAVQQALMKNNLTRLLKSAAAKSRGETLSSVHREALREICASTNFAAEQPEKLLIEFKACLTEAANEAGIRPGPERNELLGHFVSAFIEELYRVSERSEFGQGNSRPIASRNSIPSRNPNWTDARR